MKQLLILCSAAYLIVCGCGGADQSKKSTETPSTTSEKSGNESNAVLEQVITVTGNTMADMSYDPLSFVVKAGTTVKLTLVNANTAEGMLHNWVLVKLGSGQEVATAAIAAGPDKNYIPENPNILAASGLAKPKETVTLEFVAPAAGSYNYICTYPGHFPRMIGKLIVE
jgi:azurin